MQTEQKGIRRFPRIPTAKDVGKGTRAAWQKPEFYVKDNEKDSSTEFRHRLNFLIPEATRRQDLSVFTMLFKVQSVEIDTEFEKAYGRTTFKGLPVSELFHRALRKVFISTMLQVFKKAKRSSDRHAKYLKGGPKPFMNAAAAKRTRQLKFRIDRAIRLARLYKKAFPFAEEVLSFLHDQQTNDEQKLKRETQEKFPNPWTTHVTSGVAFQHLPDIPGHYMKCSLQNPECTARQLAVGIIWSVEDESGIKPSLSPNTILEHYLSLGKKHSGKSKFLKHR